MIATTSQPEPEPAPHPSGRHTARPLPLDAAFVDGVGSLLESRTGLVFPGGRRALLDRAAAMWLEELGASPGAPALGLLAEADGTPWNRLVSLATVGETYFFRHREQLDAFVRIALPRLVEARQNQQVPVVRAWSVGCSSGEEPYSLAMLLEENLPDRGRWQVRVVGTDIDVEALARARVGVYGRWAFRAGGDERARWFNPVPGGEQVQTRIRDLVTFEHHNIVDPRAVPPAALAGPADVVVCRNMTIYMSPEATRSVAARVYEALAPGGWLLVGPVEPSSETYHQFVPHHADGITLYQRPLTEHAHRLPHLVGASTTSQPARRAVAPPVARPKPVDPPPRVAAPEPAALLVEARALADAGRLDEALARCQSALARDRRLPLGFALLATIAEARGDLDGACHALGRAGYLEPTDPAIQFRLGLLEWRRGRTAKARARLRAAVRLLDGRPDERPLDGHDGLTAGRIRSVATTMLD